MRGLHLFKYFVGGLGGMAISCERRQRCMCVGLMWMWPQALTLGHSPSSCSPWPCQESGQPGRRQHCAPDHPACSRSAARGRPRRSTACERKRHWGSRISTKHTSTGTSNRSTITNRYAVVTRYPQHKPSRSQHQSASPHCWQAPTATTHNKIPEKSCNKASQTQPARTRQPTHQGEPVA